MTKYRTVFPKDINQFAEVAGTWLARSPVENNILLTAIQSEKHGKRPGAEPALLAWVEDEAEQVQAAFMWMPPFLAPVSSGSPEAISVLVRDLVGRNVPLTGVTARTDVAAEFTRLWTELTGQTASPGRESALSRLDSVITPPQPAGH